MQSPRSDFLSKRFRQLHLISSRMLSELHWRQVEGIDGIFYNITKRINTVLPIIARPLALDFQPKKATEQNMCYIGYPRSLGSFQ